MSGGGASGGNWSQIAAIAGVFEDFGGMVTREARAGNTGRGGWTVEQWKGRRRGLVVHKNARK